MYSICKKYVGLYPVMIKDLDFFTKKIYKKLKMKIYTFLKNFCIKDRK